MLHKNKLLIKSIRTSPKKVFFLILEPTLMLYEINLKGFLLKKSYLTIFLKISFSVAYHVYNVFAAFLDHKDADQE